MPWRSSPVYPLVWAFLHIWCTSTRRNSKFRCCLHQTLGRDTQQTYYPKVDEVVRSTSWKCTFEKVLISLYHVVETGIFKSLTCWNWSDQDRSWFEFPLCLGRTLSIFVSKSNEYFHSFSSSRNFSLLISPFLCSRLNFSYWSSSSTLETL